MSEGSLKISGYSTYDIRVRAVHAVVEKGLSITAVARTCGTDRSTIHRWLNRFEAKGHLGLQRSAVPGRPRILEMLDSNALSKIVLAPASQFGFETDFWTTGRLRQVIQSEYEIRVSKQTILRRLHDADLTYQKPERRYFEASEKEREQWRREILPQVRAAVQEHQAILYFQDEASISLTALLGKTWAPKGKTPKQTVTGKRGSVAAMSAISVRGHLIFRLHEKRITSIEVIDFLGQMLKHHRRRHLVVVMDQAPPHTSNATKEYIESQRRLHVFHLPKYSPDWNPDEKVWNHLKHQELKGHNAKTKDEIKELANTKLTNMAANPSLLRGIYYRCCMADVFVT
jgi:transposase